jgi:hypothetical protein
MFAKVLNVNVKIVQSWESGTRVPSHAALRLLEIVNKAFLWVSNFLASIIVMVLWQYGFENAF